MQTNSAQAMSTAGGSRPESASWHSYCQDSRSKRRMTDAEEVAAFARLRDGDMSARDELFTANRGYVINLAMRFKGSPLALEDLVQEGNIGMLRAIDKFDASRGIRFVLYARWWIRQAFQSASLTSGYIVATPKSDWTNCQHALRVESKIMEKQCRNIQHRPSTAEIMKASGENIACVTTAQIMRYGLKGRLGARADSEGDEICPDNKLPELMTVPPEQFISLFEEDKKKMAAAVLHCMEILRDKEMDSYRRDDRKSRRTAEIFERYFGLSGQEPETLEAIGDSYGLTRERIRQIKEVAIDKINASPRFAEIKAEALELINDTEN